MKRSSVVPDGSAKVCSETQRELAQEIEETGGCGEFLGRYVRHCQSEERDEEAGGSDSPGKALKEEPAEIDLNIRPVGPVFVEVVVPSKDLPASLRETLVF